MDQKVAGCLDSTICFQRVTQLIQGMIALGSKAFVQ